MKSMIRDFYYKPFPTLDIDDALYLREQSIEDTDAFFEYYADPEVSRYILAGTPKTPSDAQNEIHYCRNLFYQRSGIYWTIARKSDDRMIGAIGLYINNAHKRAEICYDLHKDCWRKGIMSKAVKVVLRFAFKKIKLCRVEAVTVKKKYRFHRISQKT